MPIFVILEVFLYFSSPQGETSTSALLASVYFHHRHVIKTSAITLLLLLPLCPSKSKVDRTVMREGDRQGEGKKGKERERRKWVPKRDEAKRSNE